VSVPGYFVVGDEGVCSVGLYPTADMCWFGLCWGNGTDVSRTGMCKGGFVNSTHLLVHVTGRWRSTFLRVLIREEG
jgi:hypothetical protein